MRSVRLIAPASWVRVAARGLAIPMTLASGCAALPVLQHLARPEQTVVSPPGEDGTQYVAVEGGPLSSRSTLRTRWRSTARRICQGDYTKLSETSLSRRAGGVVRSRVHEGYVQCVLPGESERGAPGTPTADDATAPPSRARSNAAP